MLCLTAEVDTTAESYCSYLQVGDAFNLRVAGQVEVLLCLKNTLCNSTDLVNGICNALKS